MQYTDKQRIAAAVAGWGSATSEWGVLGALIIRAADFVDRMKQPEALARVRDFLRRCGVRGAAVLSAYTDVNPFGIVLGTDTGDAYVDYAEEFMESWESQAHARIGGHGRVCVLVNESFASFGHDERVYLPCVSRIAERIWWRGFSNLDNRKET